MEWNNIQFQTENYSTFAGATYPKRTQYIKSKQQLMAPRKRSVEEITNLIEPEFTPVQRERFEEGIQLFNTGKFWHAHEAWEDVWKELDHDAEIILRGLIQLAAGMHLRSIGREEGAFSNVNKALTKLRLVTGKFWGIQFDRLKSDALNVLNEYGTQLKLEYYPRSY